MGREHRPPTRCRPRRHVHECDLRQHELVARVHAPVLLDRDVRPKLWPREGRLVRVRGQREQRFDEPVMQPGQCHVVVDERHRNIVAAAK